MSNILSKEKLYLVWTAITIISVLACVLLSNYRIYCQTFVYPATLNLVIWGIFTLQRLGKS